MRVPQPLGFAPHQIEASVAAHPGTQELHKRHANYKTAHRHLWSTLQPVAFEPPAIPQRLTQPVSVGQCSAVLRNQWMGDKS